MLIGSRKTEAADAERAIRVADAAAAHLQVVRGIVKAAAPYHAVGAARRSCIIC